MDERRSATRTRTVGITWENPDGSYGSTTAVKRATVSIQRGARPVVVSGYGIGEARFVSLEDAYNTFCGFLAPIKLDYLGCEAIEGCLYDLGYTPEKPY